MAKSKSVPMRMCIACREMKPKKEMLRVVKTAEGEIAVDPTGKVSGRGAYVCGSEDCIQKATNRKLLNKAFSADVATDVYADVKGGEKND